MPNKKRQILIVTVLLFVCAIGFAREDERLCPSAYYTVDGLEGRANYCEELYVDDICETCTTTDSNAQCLAEYSTVLTYQESTSQVGVSQYLANDKRIFMAGTIQPSYDDGRDTDCARISQVYETVDRSSNSVPGLTNMVIGFRIPSICDAGGDVCQWSTMYAGGRLPDNTDFSVYDILPDDTDSEIAAKQELKNSVDVDFPVTMGYPLLYNTVAPGSNKILAKYIANVDKELPSVDDQDIIMVLQHVYKPDDEPYFDVTWELYSFKNTYTGVKFFNAIDTATSGNDFGYGYLCDITKISGGTGGESFFQGTVALNPSERQFEGWWVKTFHQLKQGELPDIDWSTPLSEDNYVPLTHLDDNAIAHQWGEINGEELEISPDKHLYISMRWTFDDPIQQSTYGTTRSLFKITSDTLGYAEDPGDLDTLSDVSPTLFDVNYDLSYWRGAIKAYAMPKACDVDDDCEDNGLSTNCEDSPECTGEDDCPKYCAISTCDVDTPSSCAGDDNICLFGFCVDGKKWETEDLDDYEPVPSERKIFTFDTDGTRYWFDTGKTSLANDAYEHMGAEGKDDTEKIAHAERIIDWTLGTINGTNENLISDNETPYANLHEATEMDYDNNKLLKVMRERYSEKNNGGEQWLLGDIAHADPVYIGAHPMNSWRDAGDPNGYYSEYYGLDAYKKRKPVLLIAANDGMLHCFDAVDGEELWAFVPWDILPKLKDLTKPYYEQLRSPTMDLRPVVHDAYDDATGWHTMLMVGSRGGGDHYWAMDISPTNDFGHITPNESAGVVAVGDQTRLKFAWYFEDEDLGLTYSIPTSGRFLNEAIPEDNSSFPATKWLVFFGSGYARNSATQMQKEAYFYAVDMFDTESGSKKAKLVSKIQINRSDPNMSGLDADGSVSGKLTNNVLSSPVVVDAISASKSYTADEENDFWQPDGFEDTVYIGDLSGHVFRFSVSYPITGTTSVKGDVLFNTFLTSSGSTLEDYYKEVVNERSLDSGGEDQTYGFYKYPRPISVQPVVWRTTGTDYSKDTFLGKDTNRNKIMVLFGSGKFDSFYDSFDEFKREVSEDVFETDYQQMFAVIDHRSGRVAWSDLLHNWVDDSLDNSQTPPKALRSIDYSGASVPDAGWYGWRIEFNSGLSDNRGEKVITEPAVWKQEDQYGGSNRKDPEWIVFFTTFTPNMQGTCDLRTIDESGGGFLMTVSAETGRNPSFAIQDINGDSLITSADYVGLTGYAGQKFTGSILSRVDVDPYSNAIYVKTGVGDPVMRIQSSGLSKWSSSVTSFYRIR